jgi:hypothetical protein
MLLKARPHRQLGSISTEARGRSLPSSPRSRARPLAASRTGSEMRCRVRQLISREKTNSLKRKILFRHLAALERPPGRRAPFAGRDDEPSISFEAARSEHIWQRFHSHNVGGSARDANRERF